MTARATTPPTALHVIAKTGTGAGTGTGTSRTGTGLEEAGGLRPPVALPGAAEVGTRATEERLGAAIIRPGWARAARDVRPFRRGASTRAPTSTLTCITMTAFGLPTAAPGSATGSESEGENERGEGDPTIACGGGVGGNWPKQGGDNNGWGSSGIFIYDRLGDGVT